MAQAVLELYEKAVLIIGSQGTHGAAEAQVCLRGMLEHMSPEECRRVEEVLVEWSRLPDFASLWAGLKRFDPILRDFAARVAQAESTDGEVVLDEPTAELEPLPEAPPARPAPPRSSLPGMPMGADESWRQIPQARFSWTPPDLPDSVLADFFAEVGEHLEAVAQMVLAVEGPEDPEMYELYRKLHTVKGNSGMVGLGELQDVSHKMEDLVKFLRDNSLAPSEPVRVLLADGAAIAMQVMALAQSGGEGVLPVRAYAARVAAALDTGLEAVPGGELAPAVAPPAVAASPVPEALPPEPAGGPTAEALLAEAGIAAGPAPLHAPGPARSSGPGAAGRSSGSTRPGDGGKAAQRMLRVNFDQVDKLALLVGEQAVKQEEVLKQVERMEEGLEDLHRHVDRGPESEHTVGYASSTLKDLGILASGLEGTSKALDLVSSDIQRAVLDLRMVPLESIFKKHQMTVFQAATAQGKKASLVVEAGETKLDKSIAEKLEEPLIHLIRNAVSHGISTPERRIQLNKPMEGTVTVRAIPQGNQVVVQVEDDGAGIDPEILRRKAVEKGFLTEEECRKLDDDRIVDLIFAPGFSTTVQVDDISGRGVGLDVVRDKINRINGSIQVISTPGEGTIFQLTLPLTLALAKVLLVQVGGEVTALPADSILRVETVEHAAVSKVEGKYMARLAGETIPLVFLNRTLGLSPMVEIRPYYTVCVATHGKLRAAFVVNKILNHTQAVIREVGPVLPSIDHCMGVTFHEGRCVLILDVGSVAREWMDRPEKVEDSSLVGRVAVVVDDFDLVVPLASRAREEHLRLSVIATSMVEASLLHDAPLVLVCPSGPSTMSVLEKVVRAVPDADVVLVSPPGAGTSPGLDALFETGVADVWEADPGWHRVVSKVKQFLVRRG